MRGGKKSLRNKQLLVISPCCGKGIIQAKKLITELAQKGIIYEYQQCTPRQASNIIEKHGGKLQDYVNHGYIYVDDLLFRADELKKDHYRKTLIEQLVIVNQKEEQNGKQQ